MNTSNIGDGEWNELAAVQLAGIPVEGDPVPPDDGATMAPRVTVKLHKPPPPPPPMPSNKIGVTITNNKPQQKVEAPTVGSPAFLEWIKGARGVLSKTTQGDHKAQKPKDKRDNDIVTALAQRFVAIRGIGMDDPETLDEWDGDDGSGASAAEWEDDDDILSSRTAHWRI